MGGKCRAFLTLKRRRVEAMQKEWCRIEDFHLSSFCKKESQRIMKEQCEQEGQAQAPVVGKEEAQKKHAFHKKLQEGVKDGKLSIDWKVYRIPTKERQLICNRFYMLQLRRRVRMQA